MDLGGSSQLQDPLPTSEQHNSSGGGGGFPSLGGDEAKEAIARGSEDLKKDRRLQVAAVGLLLAVIGLFIIWVKIDNDRVYAYSIGLILSGVLNVVGYQKKNMWLPCVAMIISLDVFDIQACYADTAFKSYKDDSDGDALKAGLILNMIGAGLTFAVFPCQKPSFDKSMIPIFFCAFLMILGNAFILASAAKYSDESGWGSYVCANSGGRATGIVLESRVTTAAAGGNYPVLVCRAILLAFFMVLTHIGGYNEGQLVTFILSAIHIPDYQPGGPRLDLNTNVVDPNLVTPGTWLVFVALWIAVLYWLFGVLAIHQSKPAKENLMQGTGAGGTGIAVGVGFLMVLVGAIMVWSEKVEAQEAWDVTQMVIGSLALLLSVACNEPTWAMVGAVFEISVMNRIVGQKTKSWPSKGPLNQCPDEYSGTFSGGWMFSPKNGALYEGGESVLRIGYTLLMIGTAAGYVGLPGLRKVQDMSKLKSDLAIMAAVPAVLFAVWAWCAVPARWARLALTGLLQIFSRVADFKPGAQVAFVFMALFLPGMSPCTSCSSGDTAKSFEFVSLVGFLFVVMDFALGAAPLPEAQKPDLSFGRSARGGAAVEASAEEPEPEYTKVPEPL